MKVPASATAEAFPNRYHQSGVGMPDFEIRFYHADGKLALVHMCIHETLQAAREFARLNLKDHARFEVRDGNRGLPPSP
jgi:hypothetical protein